MKNWIMFIVVVIAGLLAVSGVAYFASENTDSHKEENEHNEDKMHEVDNTNTSGDSSYTINKVPLPSIEDLMPNLNRETQFSPSTPENVRTILSQDVATLKERLENDPTRGDDWIDLGLLYHTAGDYEGSRLVWEFLVQVDQNNPVPVENLAKLYHFQIPNYPKSESLFRQAMGLDRNSITPYIGLYELYRYSYKKETTAAADILKEAMVSFPNEISLYLTLGGYYRDIGQTNLAKQTFLEGLDKAREAENVLLIAEFGKELDRVQ